MPIQDNENQDANNYEPAQEDEEEHDDDDDDDDDVDDNEPNQENAEYDDEYENVSTYQRAMKKIMKTSTLVLKRKMTMT